MPNFRPLPSTLAVYKRVVVADPSAGSEFTFTVPSGKWWEVMLAYVQLVQGLTQTPQPILQFDDGTNLLAESFGSSAAQGVSTTAAYTWGPGLPLSGQVGTTPNIRSNAPLPDAILGPGYRVKSLTLGIGANSDYGVPSLYIVEYG